MSLVEWHRYVTDEETWYELNGGRPDDDRFDPDAELRRVLGDVRLRHPRHRGRHAGGEWDPVLALPPATLRRLAAGRYLRPTGLDPDELEDIVAAAVGESRIPDTDTAIRWYVDLALAALDERAAHPRRAA